MARLTNAQTLPSVSTDHFIAESSGAMFGALYEAWLSSSIKNGASVDAPQVIPIREPAVECRSTPPTVQLRIRSKDSHVITGCLVAVIWTASRTW